MNKRIRFIYMVGFVLFFGCNSNHKELEQLKNDVKNVDYSIPFNLKFLYYYESSYGGEIQQPIYKMFNLDSLSLVKPKGNIITFYYSLNSKENILSDKELLKITSSIQKQNDSLRLFNKYYRVIYYVCKETYYTNTFYKLGLDEYKCKIFANLNFIEGQLE